MRFGNCICSRGIRKAYSEAFQTEMMNDAYKQWYQLEYCTSIISLAIWEKMYDYIVIGAGINGSWSALHLAKRGHKVLLLEQVKYLVHLA